MLADAKITDEEMQQVIANDFKHRFYESVVLLIDFDNLLFNHTEYGNILILSRSAECAFSKNIAALLSSMLLIGESLANIDEDIYNMDLFEMQKIIDQTVVGKTFNVQLLIRIKKFVTMEVAKHITKVNNYKKLILTLPVQYLASDVFREILIIAYDTPFHLLHEQLKKFLEILRGEYFKQVEGQMDG